MSEPKTGSTTSGLDITFPWRFGQHHNQRSESCDQQERSYPDCCVIPHDGEDVSCGDPVTNPQRDPDPVISGMTLEIVS